MYLINETFLSCSIRGIQYSVLILFVALAIQLSIVRFENKGILELTEYRIQFVSESYILKGIQF